MAARHPNHQRAIARVALLSRWRSPDDPDLAQARRALAVARAQARLADATAAVATAAAALRSLDTAASVPSGQQREEVAGQ